MTEIEKLEAAMSRATTQHSVDGEKPAHVRLQEALADAMKSMDGEMDCEDVILTAALFLGSCATQAGGGDPQDIAQILSVLGEAMVGGARIALRTRGR